MQIHSQNQVTDKPLNCSEIVKMQRAYFQSDKTQSITFRLAQLRKLKWMLKDNEEAIFEALKADFNKPALETYATEIAIVLKEIELMRDHLYQWASPQRVKDSLINYPSVNYIYPEPYGVVLIIGAWNYPLQLTLNPLVGAIAAGNCAVVKPSELVPHTSALLSSLIAQNFGAEYIRVVEGDAKTGQELLAQPWNYIFFTGSNRVGKIVAKAAAENMIPVTLELGGKNPCVIDETANIDLAARRIVWGKFMNAGQTCIAPDYLWVHPSVNKELLAALNKYIIEFYGENPQNSPDYARIVNRAHFDRLCDFLSEGQIAIGGQTQAHELFISPTVLKDITWESRIMQEEIFGPILPILSYENLDEVVQKLQSLPKALSFYYFTENKYQAEKLIQKISFGGGCINDTVAYFANSNLPFGGLGNSGMGAYHGKNSFDTFTHRKSVMKKATWLDIPLRYAPYQGKINMAKWLFWLAK